MVKVKSLRDFAFEVVYQEIKSEFDVIYLPKGEEKQRAR